MEMRKHITENDEVKPTTYRQEDVVIHVKCLKCGTMNSRVEEIKMVSEV